tara:strand:+ start:614 stop:1615 length:1002 start_codon:yes stop_codon:yes gene_type:complete
VEAPNKVEQSMNDAMDQILEGPEQSGDNLQVPDTKANAEPEQPIDEIPQDEIEPVDQAEEVEAADDDSDLLDYEADDVESETEQVDEPDHLYPVKIDGKEEMWTLDKLQQSAAGQGYINKRMQEIAAVEKNYKSELEALTAQRQQMLAFFEQAQNGIQEPTPPSSELFNDDPIGYMQEKLKYDESKTQYDAKVAQMNQLQTQQSAANEARLQEYTANQAQLLTQRLPEIADPKKGEAIKQGIASAGEYYGFTPEELGSVRDHRYILAMHDAMRYRNLVAKKAKATSQKKESIATVKAGSKKRPQSQSERSRKDAMKRLRQTGDPKDAMPLIFE